MSEAGAAVIFERDAATSAWATRGTWEWPFLERYCGSAVAVRGSRAVVTCDGGYAGHGQHVHFLLRSPGNAAQWGEVGDFLPTGGDAGAYASALPVSAAAFASDDRVIVGDGWSDRDGRRAGAVRAFTMPEGASPISEGFASRHDAGFADEFGRGVAQRGDWLFVGSIGDNTVGDLAGRVTVFARAGDGWQPVQVLHPDEGIDTQYFGISVALGEGFAAVGGSGIRDANGVRIGGVHIYRLNGGQWERAAFLQPTGLPPSARFGRPLAVDGTRLAVGSPVSTLSGPSIGYVHVFERGADASAWTLRREIQRTGPAEERPLGYSLVLAGDVLVATTTRGDTFVHERNHGGADTWGLYQSLPVPRVADAGPFNVAVEGSTIVVGSAGLSGNASPSDVRVYERVAGAWTLVQTIPRAASDETPYGKFGTSIALRDDWLVASGVRFAQNPTTLALDTVETYLRYFRRGGGVFREWARSTLPTPVASYPEAPDSPLVIGDEEVAIGIPNLSGEAPSNIRYAGAVFMTRRDALPLWVDGFE